MQTWIIHFSNQHFCGGDHEVLVTANTAQEAEDLAHDFMWEYQWSLFSDHFEEDGIDPDLDGLFSVEVVEPFDINHRLWTYRQDIDTI